MFTSSGDRLGRWLIHRPGRFVVIREIRVYGKIIARTCVRINATLKEMRSRIACLRRDGVRTGADGARAATVCRAERGAELSVAREAEVERE